MGKTQEDMIYRSSYISAKQNLWIELFYRLSLIIDIFHQYASLATQSNFLLYSGLGTTGRKLSDELMKVLGNWAPLFQHSNFLFSIQSFDEYVELSKHIVSEQLIAALI